MKREEEDLRAHHLPNLNMMSEHSGKKISIKNHTPKIIDINDEEAFS
jgi:hypothetical protein